MSGPMDGLTEVELGGIIMAGFLGGLMVGAALMGLYYSLRRLGEELSSPAPPPAPLPTIPASSLAEAARAAVPPPEPARGPKVVYGTVAVAGASPGMVEYTATDNPGGS